MVVKAGKSHFNQRYLDVRDICSEIFGFVI